MVLPQNVYEQDSLIIAELLLGCYLATDLPEGRTLGRIVETEAYLINDPAAHSSGGKTPRTEVMFSPPGKAYVYLSYGIHNCFNLTSGPLQNGEAILIRALEPVEGIELMKARRHKETLHDLANGPGKLTQAMGIKLIHNGTSLITGPITILSADHNPQTEKIIVTRGPRIGIPQAKDEPYRFYIKDNPFVSRK